jgi:polar amino acid transport system substrate-binding protein
VAFKRRGADLNWPAEKLPMGNLQNLLLRGGRLAVPASYFLGPDVEAVLTSGEFEGQILRPASYNEAVEMVVSGRADVFLCDRLSGPGVAWRAGVIDRIEEIPGVFFESDLCIMLSRKRRTSDDLGALNTSLMEMSKSGEIERMMRYYLVPRILLITLKSRWFEILEIVGTVAFAISGVIIARREHYDVTGAIVLAALPAVGGGVIRDLVNGRSPVGIIQSPQLFLMVIGTAFVGFLFYSVRDFWARSERPPEDLTKRHSLRWAFAVCSSV